MRSINDSSEKLSAAGRPTIMVVAPQIRRVFSDFVRAHIPDMIILSFTELPENRAVLKFMPRLAALMLLARRAIHQRLSLSFNLNLKPSEVLNYANNYSYGAR